jgi:hypothetical protein
MHKHYFQTEKYYFDCSNNTDLLEILDLSTILAKRAMNTRPLASNNAIQFIRYFLLCVFLLTLVSKWL